MATHRTIYRKDYTPPPFVVNHVELRFELGEETTRVRSRLQMQRNPTDDQASPLVLDGHRFRLLHICIDGVALSPGEYELGEAYLAIQQVPGRFTLEVETELKPQENTFLEGLYRSGGMFCTQCEAEGFRSITYYPDRPDVLARFTTTVVADRSSYPVLLSNGNPVEWGELSDGRHYATWQDPFPKPSYLFALVAGNLSCRKGSFVTRSGREVELHVYVEERNLEKCDHAIRSLQKAMKWDEDQFDREYDLDLYMIVAVDDFNMGAMENKGLNIFNSRYVLASPATATDDDFQAIEEVIGHEYFHNWTGNRITCRDWFQLSLKEGLTIFRDQEFSADMESRGVKRIADVRYLRTHQFSEDAGPMAHPVRPDQYIEINNFYTVTVYNKGAEIIRMLRTLLGPERFRAGMELYFSRFDGQAVTVDDFIQSMADAGETDLTLFSRWYSQAGTPRLEVAGEHSPETGTFTLRLRQSTPATPGQQEKEPLHIPVALALLDREGTLLPIRLEGETPTDSTEAVLQLRQPEEEFRFTGLPERPVPALLRNFSAPVRLSYPYSREDLLLLMSHERDPFSRWEAIQQLATETILQLADNRQEGVRLGLEDGFIAAMGTVLQDKASDRAFIAEALTLPGESYLGELMPVIDPDALFAAREYVRKAMGLHLREALLSLYRKCNPGLPYAVDDGRAGDRRLANLCLAYLMTGEEKEIIDLCLQRYRATDNMTERIGALVPLISCRCPEREEALDDFYHRWQDDRQVIDKWFALQAGSTLPETVSEVTRLLDHPAFEYGNPNRFRSLVATFAANQVRFHAADGSGYRFLADQLIRLIPLNPQVSARMLTPLTRWRRYDPPRQALMLTQLERLKELPALPRDVYEVLERTLPR